MTIFNRSSYRYLKTDVIKKAFYEKLFSRCYRNPTIEMNETNNEIILNVHNAADQTFYMLMNPIIHCQKNYDKYKDNIDIIAKMIKNMENDYTDKYWETNFKNSFANDMEILECVKCIPEIHKYAIIPIESRKYIFTFGHEYQSKENNMFNVNFNISKDKISNGAFTPYFDIDGGFISNVEETNELPYTYLNNIYREWLARDCAGNLFPENPPLLGYRPKNQQPAPIISSAPVFDDKVMENMRQRNDTAMKFAKTLITKGHTCVCYLESYPVQISWCRQNICTGSKFS